MSWRDRTQARHGERGTERASVVSRARRHKARAKAAYDLLDPPFSLHVSSKCSVSTRLLQRRQKLPPQLVGPNK